MRDREIGLLSTAHVGWGGGVGLGSCLQHMGAGDPVLLQPHLRVYALQLFPLSSNHFASQQAQVKLARKVRFGLRNMLEFWLWA